MLIPVHAEAGPWQDLWQTKDQQGAQLLAAGQAKEAAHTFKNKEWQTVASYRAGDYTEAYQRFKSKNTSDAQYNAGNALAFLSRYKEAIAAYDKAIALNPKNADAITNREIIKKLLQEQQQNKQNQSSQNQDKQQQQNQAENKENNKNKDQQGQQQTQNSQQQQPPKDNSKNEQSKNEEAKNDNQQQQQNISVDQQKTDPKDDDKKQMLRRLVDDPGGLLRQKFLRDYYKRHTGDNTLSQGGD